MRKTINAKPTILVTKNCQLLNSLKNFAFTELLFINGQIIRYSGFFVGFY